MAASFDNTGPGRFRVNGPMTFETVMGLLQQSRAPLANAGNVEIDLAQVVEADSAGLALLIEWKRLARLKNGSITYTDVPRQLTALASISEVEELLSATAETTRQPESAAAG